MFATYAWQIIQMTPEHTIPILRNATWDIKIDIFLTLSLGPVRDGHGDKGRT